MEENILQHACSGTVCEEGDFKGRAFDSMSKSSNVEAAGVEDARKRVTFYVDVCPTHADHPH